VLCFPHSTVILDAMHCFALPVMDSARLRHTVALTGFAGHFLAFFILLLVRMPCHSEAASPTRQRSLFDEVPVVRDQEIISRLLTQGEQLLTSSNAVLTSTLNRQLSRRQCSLKLPRGATGSPAPIDPVGPSQQGVLIVAEVYKCKRCGKYHANPASGFFLTDSGALATCYHVLDSAENGTLLAMTREGATFAVREVLAANRETDVVILRAQAREVHPLPLSPTPAPVGSKVRVLSHPDSRFFVLTEGLVSRYQVDRIHQREVVGMTITADFAKGSSGAPVFDETGAVIALVRSTTSIYYSETNGVKNNLQMVLKDCIPSRYLLDLIRPEP
jgi:serine protease Do